MLTQYMLHSMTQCVFIKLSRIKHLELQRFLPVIAWHFLEDSEQELNFSPHRHGHHIGPWAQSETFCQVPVGYTLHAIARFSELGIKGGWQCLPEAQELEET